ncbi:MAG: hypothetical protein IKK08_09740 [Clostridia bacterium]|nr:hypothetical protein [Clostridia bacterium]
MAYSFMNSSSAQAGAAMHISRERISSRERNAFFFTVLSPFVFFYFAVL